jgi:hypothetical protein
MRYSDVEKVARKTLTANWILRRNMTVLSMFRYMYTTVLSLKLHDGILSSKASSSPARRPVVLA